MATALLLRMGEPQGLWLDHRGRGFRPVRARGRLEIGRPDTCLTMLCALLTIALVGSRWRWTWRGGRGAALTPITEWRLVRSALQIGLHLQPASIALWLNLKIDLLLVGLLATPTRPACTRCRRTSPTSSSSRNRPSRLPLGAQTKAEARRRRSPTRGLHRPVPRRCDRALALAAASVAYPFVVSSMAPPGRKRAAIRPPDACGGRPRGRGPSPRDLLIRIAPPLAIRRRRRPGSCSTWGSTSSSSRRSASPVPR